MPKVHIGTIFLPILLTPRIDGLAVKVSDIKNTYSGKYISDVLTPLDFHLEYEVRGGTPQVIDWDPTSSTDSLTYFPVPDAVYASEITYSVIFFWTVKSGSNVIEKIPTQNKLVLEVLDLHNNPG